jgi:hypothetical protein
MMMDTDSNNAKNVKRSAKALAESIELGTPVAVQISDGKVVHSEFRGKWINGIWKGVSPAPQVHPAIRDQEDGWHWIAHVVDVRNKELIYDIHLAIIKNIDTEPNKIRAGR